MQAPVAAPFYFYPRKYESLRQLKNNRGLSYSFFLRSLVFLRSVEELTTVFLHPHCLSETAAAASTREYTRFSS